MAEGAEASVRRVGLTGGLLGFALGGFVGGRITKANFTYTAASLFGQENEEVTLSFTRVMGGVLASYRF